MSKFAPHRRGTNNPRATSSTVCQKCLSTGHFTFECKNTRPYVSRPSRTQQLEKPNALAKLKSSGQPSVEVPEEFKTKTGTANRILEAREKQREESSTKGKGPEVGKKRTKRSSSDSDSDSDSDSGSDSSSSSDSDSSSASGSSDDSRSRRQKRQRTRRSRSASDRGRRSRSRSSSVDSRDSR